MSDNASLTEITEDLKDAGTYFGEGVKSLGRAGLKIAFKAVEFGSKVAPGVREVANEVVNTLSGRERIGIEDELTEALSKPCADVFNLNDCVVVATPENFMALKKNLLPRVKLPPELLDELTHKIIQDIKDNLNDLPGGTLYEHEEHEIRKVLHEYFDSLTQPAN